MEIKLVRQYHARGVNGTLFLGDSRICDTIELPWLENKRRVSCIPENRYRVYRRYTPRFGWHCLVESVPGRDGILIHSFNNALKESKGCIGPVSQLEGPGIGASSRPALRKLMEVLTPAFDRNQPVYLTIQSDQHDSDSTGTEAHAEVLP